MKSSHKRVGGGARVLACAVALGCVTSGDRAASGRADAAALAQEKVGSPASTAASTRTVDVRDVDALRAAVRQAKPGTRIRIAPGEYVGGHYFENVRGEKNRPIVIEAADPKNPPVFRGTTEGMHFSKVAYLELHNLNFVGASHNGLNIDDGGTYVSPSHHVVLRGLTVRDIPRGNHDAIKISGLEDFLIENCRIENWGGSGVDMVGCHRGVIQNNVFRHKAGNDTGSTGVQAKGGTREIVIQGNRFENAGSRSINIGGSTGLEFFRPRLMKDATTGAYRLNGEEAYEAKRIVVRDNIFIGSDAPVAFVGVDEAVVTNNTFYLPNRWAMRILQEMTAPGFVPARKGVFTDNIIVFNAGKWAEGGVNIGPKTKPETFVFSENVWYAMDNPERSRPTLPSAETGGVYGKDPLFTDPEKGDFRLRSGSAAEGKGARPAPDRK